MLHAAGSGEGRDGEAGEPDLASNKSREKTLLKGGHGGGPAPGEVSGMECTDTQQTESQPPPRAAQKSGDTAQ